MGRDSYFDPYPYIVLQSYKWDDWLRWRAFLGWVWITNQIILTYSRITCYGSDSLVDHGPIFMSIRFKIRETHVKISIIQRWTSGFWSKFPAKFLNPVNFLQISIQNPIFFQNSIEFWKIHLLALGNSWDARPFGPSSGPWPDTLKTQWESRGRDPNELSWVFWERPLVLVKRCEGVQVVVQGQN